MMAAAAEGGFVHGRFRVVWRTLWKTESRGQGTATRHTSSSRGEPDSRRHSAPFRALQDSAGLSWRWSREKLETEE